MNVFGIGLPEMAVIAAVALLVFGPKRLPEFGRTLGKTLEGDFSRLPRNSNAKSIRPWLNLNP
jgi:TatA/E family protein of Tat protein translocase